jgi:Uma2 family endonuclease
MPIGEEYAATVELLGNYFHTKFGLRYRLRSENPVTLSDDSEPEPDFVIARKQPGKGRLEHPRPTDILLLIEVARHTLEKDRKLKGPIYAAAGIPKYWIINLIDRQLEHHTDPDPKNSYQRIEIHSETATFQSPFAGPVQVTDLLPLTP